MLAITGAPDVEVAETVIDVKSFKGLSIGRGL